MIKIDCFKKITDIYEEFIRPKKRIILEGDQATYERLQCIKVKYGHDLDWMNILKNFMKFF
jgi:hypothetical protein